MKALLLLLLVTSLWGNLKQDVIKMEGYSQHVYKDSTGNLTAGIGHQLTKNEMKSYSNGMKVSNAQINYWFGKDISKALRFAKEASKRMDMDDDHFTEALTQMYFQLGGNGGKQFVAFEKAMKERKHLKAQLELYNSNWNVQTPKRVQAMARAVALLKWRYGA